MTDKDFFWWNFVKYKYQQQCTLLTEDPDESFSFLHRAQWKLRVTYTISWEVLDITFLVRFQQLNPLLGFMSHWCTFWVILRQATKFFTVLYDSNHSSVTDCHFRFLGTTLSENISFCASLKTLVWYSENTFHHFRSLAVSTVQMHIIRNQRTKGYFHIKIHTN